MSETKKLNTEVTQPDVPKQYQGLLDANPYLNLDYKQSGWQKFLSALGFRTNYDAYKESMQVQANEYNASVAEKAYNEQYESPEAEAARARSAGLNPDLTGVEGVSGASPLADDGNPPIPSESDAAQVGQFANMIFSAVSMATGFAKDFGALRSLRLANESKEIENVRGLHDTALDTVMKHLPSEVPKSKQDWLDNYSAISTDIRLTHKPFMSKRQYKRFKQAVGSFYLSLPVEENAYKQYLSQLRNKQATHLLEKSDYFNEDEEVLREVIEPLVELNDRVLRASSSADALGAENRESYAQTAKDIGLPAEEAIEASEENKHKTQEFNMQRELRSALSKIIHNLQNRANSNKFGHGFAETLLLVMSMMSMMSFGSSGSSIKFGN